MNKMFFYLTDPATAAIIGGENGRNHEVVTKWPQNNDEVTFNVLVFTPNATNRPPPPHARRWGSVVSRG